MPGFHSVLKDLEAHLQNVSVKPAMSCTSCAHGPRDLCNRRLYWSKNFCRYWTLSGKWEICKSAIENQLEQQKQRSYEREWHCGNKRRLELL